MNPRKLTKPLNKCLTAAALLVATAGFSAHAATNLAFLMDKSGSIADSDYAAAMDALAAALSVIPTDSTYKIGVITFNSDASPTLVAPTVVDSAATLAGIQATIAAETTASGNTCYSCAFDKVAADWGVLAADDNSIINMMTDGVPTAGDTSPAGLLADVTALRNTNNWDGLSFEAVDNFSNPPNSVFLSNLAFDTGGIGGASIIDDPANINSPVSDNAFVLEVAGFGTAYTAAIDAKLEAIVNPVPIPAAVWLFGSALVGVAGIARKKKSAANAAMAAA